jgi:hypothetical protein
LTDYNVDYLRRLEDAVDRFETAFEAWMQTQVELTHMETRGLFPTVSTKQNVDENIVQNLELDVAKAAGLAACAVSVTGAYIGVRGMGLIDPISNWFLMSEPKAVLDPREIRVAVSNIKGRLDSMIFDAEAKNESALPGFSPANFHKIIWTAAAAYWTTHKYRVAVREAAEALTAHWKTKLHRTDIDGTAFWQQTLSSGDPLLGKPKLTWPGESTDKTVKSMRGGLEPMTKALMYLATGENFTIRNVTTHTRGELSEQEAMERLSAYSYLARLLDHCEIREVKDTEIS